MEHGREDRQQRSDGEAGEAYRAERNKTRARPTAALLSAASTDSNVAGGKRAYNVGVVAKCTCY